MRYARWLLPAMVAAGGLGTAAAIAAKLPPTPINGPMVSATAPYPRRGLAGRRCALTAWYRFSYTAAGHQPWFFVMRFGARTGCGPTGALKTLRVSVWVMVPHSRRWTRVAVAPLAAHGRRDPLQVSGAWHSRGPADVGTISRPVVYRVRAAGTIAYTGTIRSAASVTAPGPLP